MSEDNEFVKVRQTIERYKGDFGWQARIITVVEDRSKNLSEEFLGDLWNDYGIELSE